MIRADKFSAWEIAGDIFPGDYKLDTAASARAGYNVYVATDPGVNAWISDLGSRLEVNTPDGRALNIWIEEKNPDFKEHELADALKVIDFALYKLEDNVTLKLQERTGLDKARAALYAGMRNLAAIIRTDYPASQLIKQYNLDEV